jgi:hypothetical protein
MPAGARFMSPTRIFDALFVNQLFHVSDKGETIFTPYGLFKDGYLVPSNREAGIRLRVRRLTLIALAGTLVLIAIASPLGEKLSHAWFFGGALTVLIIEFFAIIRQLQRLTLGLKPVARKDI